MVDIQIERYSLIGAYLLQEIPAQGCDWWWDISSPSSKGSKLPCGKCRIKLHLSHQQVIYQSNLIVFLNHLHVDIFLCMCRGQ